MRFFSLQAGLIGRETAFCSVIQFSLVGKITKFMKGFFQHWDIHFLFIKPLSLGENEFKHGITSVEDAPRSGDPKTAVIPEINDEVHGMEQVAVATGISIEKIELRSYHFETFVCVWNW